MVEPQISGIKRKENMLNKKILIPVIVLGILATGAAIWSTGIAKAQNNRNGEAMSQELAQKLGIDQSKVNDAMSQIRSEHQAERKAEIEKKLSQAVTDGKITEAQKTAILAKQTEMQQSRGKERQEHQQWLADNNLDVSVLKDYGIGGMGMGGGSRGHGPF